MAASFPATLRLIGRGILNQRMNCVQAGSNLRLLSSKPADKPAVNPGGGGAQYKPPSGAEEKKGGKTKYVLVALAGAALGWYAYNNWFDESPKQNPNPIMAMIEPKKAGSPPKATGNKCSESSSLKVPVCAVEPNPKCGKKSKE